MASFKGLRLFLFASAVVAMIMMGGVRASGSRHFLVGDSHGWSEPSHHMEFYDRWAQKNSPFHVGDVLSYKASLKVESNEDLNTGFGSFGEMKCTFEILYNISRGDYSMYKSDDSVSVVDKEGYYHCHYNDTTANYTDGNTKFTLTAPVIYYFVSLNLHHCKDGLRLLINATSPHDDPSPPPPPSSAPSSAPTLTPAPAPSLAAPVTPPASSAVSNQLATWPILIMAIAAAFVFFVPLQL
ncbi:hypothetical protein ACLOJK_021138 [Asimina triloba]